MPRYIYLLQVTWCIEQKFETRQIIQDCGPGKGEGKFVPVLKQEPQLEEASYA